MSDTATLQFRADVGPINQAASALDTVTAAAGRAEQAADRVGKSISDVGKQQNSGLAKTKKELADLLNTLDPTAKAFDDLDRSMKQLSDARVSGILDTEQFNNYAKIIDVQRGKIQSIRDDLSGYSAEQKSAQAATKALSDEQNAFNQRLQELSGKLDPVNNALRNIQATQAEVNALWKSGDINSIEWTRYSATLEETRKQLSGEADAERESARAKEQNIAAVNRLRAALDPAFDSAQKLQQQMSILNNAKASGIIDAKVYDTLKNKLNDVSTAAKKSEISAGQMKAGWANATQQFIDIGVTLQGGMSPITVLTQQGPQLATAFGSLGNTFSVFASLITPVTVGITALAAGVAYLGYEVYDSYRQTDELNKALARTGGQAGVTSAQLKDMAKILKDSTGASASNSEKAVLAAASLAKTRGELEQYASVALKVSQDTGESVDDLVKRFAKLSGDPIDALKELGNEFGFISPKLYEQVRAMNDAGDRAGAYALVMDGLQKSAENFKDGQRGNISEVKGFWQELIDKTREYLNTAQEVPKIEVPGSPGANPLATGNVWLDNANKAMKKSQDEAAKAAAANFDVLNDAAKNTLDFVTKTGERTKEAANAAMAIDAKSPQYQLQSARIAEQMKETQQQINKIRAGGDKEALSRAQDLYSRQQKSYDDALKAEAKKGKTKEKAVQVDAGDKITEQYQAQNLALDAQIKMLQERTSGELNASQQRKSYYELQAKFAVLEEAQKSRVLTKQEQQLLASKDQVLAEAKVTAEKGDQVALLQRQAQINDEIASKSQAIDMAIKSQADNAGRSSRDIQRAVRDAEMLAKLTAQGATEIQKANALQANARQDAAEDSTRDDWINSGKTAFADWADAATNYADIAKSAVTGAMDTAADAITSFVLTGKMDFADFAKSILKMISEIITKMMVAKAIQATITAFGGGGFSANANGGVYQDPSLHRYANQVYDTPQFFQFGGRSQFAKGGVFAEAGPEAIMPLSRDANGRLGVKAEGATGGGGMVAINQTVNIDSNGASAQTDAAGTGKAVGDQLKAVVITEVQRMMKPGGLLYNSGRR